jgi:hypothetical protein
MWLAARIREYERASGKPIRGHEWAGIRARRVHDDKFLSIFNDVDGGALAGSISGDTISNPGARGRQTFDLPAAQAGFNYTIVCSSANSFVVKSAAGAQIFSAMNFSRRQHHRGNYRAHHHAGCDRCYARAGHGNRRHVEG